MKFATRTTFILITFLISFNSAQQTIEGYVIDSTTTKPIYNVNLSLVSTSEGTTSDKNGYFNFNTDLLYPMELQLSHIGYKPKQIIITYSQMLHLQLVLNIITSDAISVFGVRSKIEKDVSASFETVTLAEMEQIGANDLSDALQTISSAKIEQVSGGKQTISIRGSNPNEVSVFLDGIRLNEANSGIANLAVIDQQDLESIEVIKGGNTSLFGSGALGGILSLSTQQPDSTKLKFHQGLGMMDDENNDLGFSAASRLGIFGFGARYSGKARRYHGRSIYTTIFKNISFVSYPSWGAFTIKGFELQDYLKFPTNDIMQNAKTRMAMFRYVGSLFGSSNWEMFAGTRSWKWHDAFFTNVTRDIEDRNSSARISRSFTLKTLNATVQLSFEDQRYRGENQYMNEVYSMSDTGILNRQTTDMATVLHWISFIDHPSLNRIQWELGYRWDNISTNHNQEFELINGPVYTYIPTNIDTSHGDNLHSIKFGSSIHGGNSDLHYHAYFNQGNSKRLPTLNDLFLWRNNTDFSATENLLPESQSTTEIGFQIIRSNFVQAPQISELSLFGSIFLNNYGNKIAYRVVEESKLIPFNTDLSSIFGYEIGFSSSFWQKHIFIRSGYQNLDIDNPIVFPNKPKSRLTFHGEFKYNWLSFSYDYFKEGEKFVLFNGFVGRSYLGYESANLSIILRFKIWRVKTSLHYVIHNLFSNEPVLSDSDQSYLTPFNFFDIHREILSLKLEL